MGNLCTTDNEANKNVLNDSIDEMITRHKVIN